ncbi:hypothetical protein [Roseisolibacter sp. H3M3-2]|uniref:hypothetical protein n=1 Tax=Roseisolibacter sp. H3M3-2 TaxID=3031323 RepID=UPI0023DA6933|nr:hypothetical protein [Roseisolibacter sp. H3M3-2]MDF1504158.1 hypothetical protein [Roseisolibacter sp. H3M3-2]
MPIRRPTPRAVLVTLAAAALAGTGCDGAARAFGPAAAAARTHVDDFFGGLAVRFVNVQRNPKFTTARGKLARHALSPSRLWGDSAVWTSQGGDARTLELDGSSDGQRYLFRAASGVPSPDRPGDARHVMRLHSLGDGAWQWNTAVEHAVGRARAHEVAAAMTGGIAALARPQADLRPVLRAGLPRTAAALGRLLTLEEARSTPLADGSRLVELRARFEPNRLKATMPAFAQYVQKWVHPSKFSLALADARGGPARWLTLTLREDVLTVRLRARADGELLALDGPARPMPDTLQFRTDSRIDYMIWDVGMDKLAGEMTAIRGAHERGWAIRWRKAPEWHIPLGVRHLMSGTLNRPFEGEGMLLRLALRDSDVSQTLLVRRFDVAVKESAIVRWIGGLGFRAMDDFSGRAEVEENRFLAEALYAMRADLGATLVASGEPGAAGPE